MKKVIWDLFGGGQNSLYKTMEKYNLLDIYEIYTFDITPSTRKHHYILDLSQDNIIEIFKQYPQPYIITASPLCQSFSCVLTMKGGGTAFWKYDKEQNKLVLRSVEEFEKLKSGFTKNLKAEVQLFLAKLGKKCIDNTIELIKYYHPQYFYIENPKRSLMWKYIMLNRTDFYNKETHFLNECSYGKYGFYITKPTYFLSNVKMELLKGVIEKKYQIIKENDKYYLIFGDEPNKKHPISPSMSRSGIYAINALKDKTLINIPRQRNKLTTHQIGEAGVKSAIPHSLLKEIFNYFQ